MAREFIFEDTIKADSEADAMRQIERLYPDAIDFNLVSRENSRGEESASGRYFVFEVSVEPDYGEFDEAPEELGEEEY